LNITNIFVFIKNNHNLYFPSKETHTQIENMSKRIKPSIDISNCTDPWTLLMETARKAGVLSDLYTLPAQTPIYCPPNEGDRSAGFGIFKLSHRVRDAWNIRGRSTNNRRYQRQWSYAQR